MDKAKNVDEYIAIQRSAIASNPECGTSHYNLGVALMGKKLYDEAKKEFLEAIEYSPTLSEAYVQLGGLCLKDGDLEGCLEHNKKAVSCRAGFSIGYGNIGFINLQLGKTDEAIAALKKAITFNNQFIQAYTTLANAYLIKGLIEESIEANKKALELSPDFAVAHNNIALAYLEKGDKQLAKKHIKEAEKLGYKVEAKVLESIKQNK